jgi:hypothetical protein
MSTLASLLQVAVRHQLFERHAVAREAPAVPEQRLWDPGLFAQEQLRRLVRQVFFPGWPRPAHHVAFAGIEEGTDIGPICMHVGQILAVQAPGNTCVVEANPYVKDEEAAGVEDTCSADLRSCARHIANKLWLLPQRTFLGECADGASAAWLECRMEKLRLAFDYTVLHVPAAAHHSEAAVLAHLSDGAVLVLEANATRRVAAHRVKETMQAANVRVLGTVLTGRTFPIPERIYRKL